MPIVFVSDSESRLWHVFPGIALPLAAHRRRKRKAGLGVSAARLGWQCQIPFYLQTLPTHCQLYPSCSRLAQELFLSWFTPHPPTSLCVPAKQNRDYRTELEILPCRRSSPGQSAAVCPGPAAPGAQPTLPNTTKHNSSVVSARSPHPVLPCVQILPVCSVLQSKSFILSWGQGMQPFHESYFQVALPYTYTQDFSRPHGNSQQVILAPIIKTLNQAQRSRKEKRKRAQTYT